MKHLIVMLVGCVVLLTGCKLGGLGFTLSAPPFGSVGLSLSGGVIGQGDASTNAPTPLPLPQ
jgi:hypothetical protein